ncbi:hypothetical protein [Bdellovibrio bacteriovorus]|uniref:Uncharacterized protein n=1 Tax=Bdellovibrio bacteriovorus str. Tiberius TaxID=1069642 RepID=K7YMN0_BDEBC|nr:hypothetical protein [Bdellovibrio bacteriovorus]AFY01051.1 hypothetical protein Bdt_1353 [Bdellovibrio bacteriovorus str. Tiberius]
MRKRYIVLIVAAFIVAIILTRPKWNVESDLRGSASGSSPAIEHAPLREGDEKANGFDTSMEAHESVPHLDVEYDSKKWSSWLKASEDFEL